MQVTSIETIIAAIKKMLDDNSPIQEIKAEARKLHDLLISISDKEELQEYVLVIKQAAGNLFNDSMRVQDDKTKADRMRETARAMLAHDLLNKTDRFTGKAQVKMVEFRTEFVYNTHEICFGEEYKRGSLSDSPQRSTAFVIASVYSASSRLWSRTKTEVDEDSPGNCIALTRSIVIDVGVNPSSTVDPDEIVLLGSLIKKNVYYYIYSSDLSHDLNNIYGRPAKKQHATRQRLRELEDGFCNRFPYQPDRLRIFFHDELRGTENILKNENQPVVFGDMHIESQPAVIIDFCLRDILPNIHKAEMLIQDLIIHDNDTSRHICHFGTV